jgi:hypothetical protein
MHEILVFYCRIKMYIVWGMWRWRELSMSPLITIRVFVPRRPFNPETTAIHNSRNAPSSKENARYEHAEFFAVIYGGRRRILSIRHSTRGGLLSAGQGVFAPAKPTSARGEINRGDLIKARSDLAGIEIHSR